MSKVVWDGTGLIKMPINEPATGLRKSQIEEYLDFYRSPGVQHVAILTDDIFHTVSEVPERGLMMMNVPDSYYSELADRVGEMQVDEAEMKRLNILADSDEGGGLLQIFTRMLQDRPTVFFNSSNGAGRPGSAKEISKPYSRRSKEIKRLEGISRSGVRGQADRNPSMRAAVAAGSSKWGR